MAYKIYTKNNYFHVVNTETDEDFEALSKDVLIRKKLVNSEDYYFSNVNGFKESEAITFEDIQDENGYSYADVETWENWYSANTGNFNSAGASAQYSTTEVNTKLKWIDNKDIYKIVLDGTTGTSSNTIDVTSLNIENIVTLNGGLDDGDVYFPCLYTQEEENGDIVISSLKYLKSDKLLVLNYYQILSGIKENIAGLSYKIIIEYTKTT